MLGSNHQGWYQPLSVYHSHRHLSTVCSAERMSASDFIVVDVLTSHRIMSKTATTLNRVMLGSNHQGWYQPLRVYHSHRHISTVCSAERMSASDFIVVDVLTSHRIMSKTATTLNRVMLGSNHQGWYQPLSVYHSHRHISTVCSAERMSASDFIVVDVLTSHRIMSKTATTLNRVMLGSNHQGWYQPLSVYHSHRYISTVCSAERMSASDFIVVDVLTSHRIMSKTATTLNRVMLGSNHQGWYQPLSVYHSHRYINTVCSAERMSASDFIVMDVLTSHRIMSKTATTLNRVMLGSNHQGWYQPLSVYHSHRYINTVCSAERMSASDFILVDVLTSHRIMSKTATTLNRVMLGSNHQGWYQPLRVYHSHRYINTVCSAERMSASDFIVVDVLTSHRIMSKTATTLNRVMLGSNHQGWYQPLRVYHSHRYINTVCSAERMSASDFIVVDVLTSHRIMSKTATTLNRVMLGSNHQG